MRPENKDHPLCLSLRSGVSFIGNYANKAFTKEVDIYPFPLEKDGGQKIDVLRMHMGATPFRGTSDAKFLTQKHSLPVTNPVGQQKRQAQPRSLESLYQDIVGGSTVDYYNEEPAEWETVICFPYDPTYTCPFMIGDKVVNRRGIVHTVVGFHLERADLCVVFEEQPDEYVSALDFEYWRLRRRVVVDWETYLVEATRGLIARDYAINQGLMLPHVTQNGKIGAVPVYDRIADAHSKTCQMASHRPFDRVQKNTKYATGSEEDVGYDAFEDNPSGLWRIYARKAAKKKVSNVYNRCGTPDGEQWATEVLNTRHTATLIKFGNQALRVVDNGVISGGQKSTKPMPPRYDTKAEELRKAFGETNGPTHDPTEKIDEENLSDEERLTELLEQGL